MDKTWFLEEGIGDYRSRLGRAAVYTLGNGYLGCRGFFDEEQEGAVETLGGIYMAGVFGKGDLKAWLGIGDWGLGPIPNPQSPIPNPQSPIPNPHFNIL